jgi:hypothetical protein
MGVEPVTRTIKQHRMSYTASVARRAASDVTHFLESTWPHTVAVHNVEEEPAYQEHDVDLLWSFVDSDGLLRILSIEIKGDRYHRTGNFFFETISNEGKGTTGCFLYTRADWLFYYFLEIGRLYCLPMYGVRPWFDANMHRFRERRTSTPVNNGLEHYITVGRLVPIQTVLDEVPGILQYQKMGERWEPVAEAIQ